MHKKYANHLNMSALCFTARSNNAGFQNPFPDGLESESFNVNVIARAYDISGAYAEAYCTVTVSLTLNRNLKPKMRFIILLYNLSWSLKLCGRVLL